MRARKRKSQIKLLLFIETRKPMSSSKHLSISKSARKSPISKRPLFRSANLSRRLLRQRRIKPKIKSQPKMDLKKIMMI